MVFTVTAGGSVAVCLKANKRTMATVQDELKNWSPLALHQKRPKEKELGGTPIKWITTVFLTFLFNPIERGESAS